jgi:hypothetical protein
MQRKQRRDRQRLIAVVEPAPRQGEHEADHERAQGHVVQVVPGGAATVERTFDAMGEVERGPVAVVGWARFGKAAQRGVQVVVLGGAQPGCPAALVQGIFDDRDAVVPNERVARRACVQRAVHDEDRRQRQALRAGQRARRSRAVVVAIGAWHRCKEYCGARRLGQYGDRSGTRGRLRDFMMRAAAER